METSPSAMAPLLLRNLITWIFINADRPLVYLSQKYKLLEFLRCCLVSTFLYFLSLLPYFFSCLSPSQEPHNVYPLQPSRDDNYISPLAAGGGGDSGVSRALCQLLMIMNDIPVSSRKYEVVRSLAERLIEENVSEGNQALREVNCAVLSAAFARSLCQLEAAAMEQGRMSGGDAVAGAGHLAKGMKYFGLAAWRYAKSRSEISRSGSSAEKVAAELLWLAQKMATSGCADEAVCKWASASNLALLSLSAEPRLQGSLVKVSAFLIKQAREMGNEEEQEDDGEMTRTPLEQQPIRQTKMKILISWLPLLCRANNGTDAPILSIGERAELERILEEIIVSLEEEEQEWVLSLWLHHFTYCPISDWPNLRSSYTNWYSASRAKLLQASAN
ncbi:hypothetical protein CDL12_05845 [Handroanthus impetiginosus]|uniref:Uncharacterized protein n=1 Tax=Handroanthus impetiginosus TaxID=429701 RepID=A0A2G9HVB8_9LAMI|nr:hypothetical protein CDL12_05845 [Handroanthus impetiginosus]